MIDAQRVDELEGVVRARLERHGAHAEYELIRTLREQGWAEFARTAADDHLALFRRHFLLFHLLYRLRDRLRREARGELAIGGLRIAIDPYRPGTEAVAPPDPLRAYYLDLSQLTATGVREVEALLDGFWGRFEAGSERSAALAVLGLEEPVDHAAVKRRYRQLVMRHHPDRGGDKARLQELNRAMTTLDRCYGR